MTAMLNLNACQPSGSTNNNNGDSTTWPNIWENPTVIGLNRLQPHSRNVRAMSIAYSKYCLDGNNKLPATNNATINPCICLDSSSLDLQQQQSSSLSSSSILTPKKGWQFRLFANPKCIPQSYILPQVQDDDNDVEKNLNIWCEQSTRVPFNWTLIPSHKYRNQPSTDGTDNQKGKYTSCCCNIHDPPRYTNVQMPFYTFYPHVPENNPTGVYRLEFALSKREIWLGSSNNSNNRRRVILHLGGVESCHFIYLNGKFVGMSKDSKLPSEYDVTSMIHCDGKSAVSTNENNTLVIIATKWSDASFLEQQDHWRGMGGIHRSIFLYSTFGEAFVEDVFCKANLEQHPTSTSSSGTTDDCDDDGDVFLKRCTGRIDVQARIGRGWNERVEGRNIYYNEEIPYTIMKRQQQQRVGGDDDDDSDDVVVEYKMLFQLYDPDNLPVFDKALDVSAAEGNPLIKDVHQRFNLLSFSADVPGYVRAWSDESPELYRLEATLVQMEGGKSGTKVTVVVDSFTTTIGFRSIRIEDRQLLINGQPVLIKGVNRHDHSPTGGKAVTLGEIRQDLMLMKEYNFNAIRTAHYPNDSYLYDLADELGLYVVDEANIECHGHYDFICREHSFSGAMLDRVQRMVIRDQNHPSIIGWSLGNEAGFAGNHTMLYGWIKGYDESRFVQYEGAHRPEWGQEPHNYERIGMGTDIICPMYPSIEEITKWAEEIAPRINETRPFIMCEYAHAMGNSSGSLADYWKIIKEKHGLQGGFIWDWIDQGLLEKDVEGNKYFAYGGDYEEAPNDANFNINGMIGPDRKPHPAMIEFKKIAQPVDFSFTLHADGNDFTICVTNQRSFSSLDDLQLKWVLKMDGFIMEEGICEFPKLMKPKTTESVTFSALKQAFDRHSIGTVIKMGSAEVHLDIRVFRVGLTRIKFLSELEDYPEVAIEQFALSTRRIGNAVHSLLPEAVHRSPNKHKLSEDDDILSLSSNGCLVTQSRRSTSFEYGIGSKTVIIGSRPNLFRGAVDNDAVKQNGDQAFDSSKPLGNWLRLGLDCLCLDEVVTTGGLNRITSTANIYGQPARQSYNGIALAEKLISSMSEEEVHLGSLKQTISIDAFGALHVEVLFELNESLTDLPRVGIEFALPSELNEMMYFADGPHENYSDRSYSSHAGVYEGSVSDSLTYVVPQEQGNRTNMRWLVLTESNGGGRLQVPKFDKDIKSTFQGAISGRQGAVIASSSSDKMHQFTVSRHTDTSLFTARHANELKDDQDRIFVRIDAAQRGLGSGSCGPQTLDQYKVNGGRYSLSFCINTFGYMALK